MKGLLKNLNQSKRTSNTSLYYLEVFLNEWTAWFYQPLSRPYDQKNLTQLVYTYSYGFRFRKNEHAKGHETNEWKNTVPWDLLSDERGLEAAA